MLYQIQVKADKQHVCGKSDCQGWCYYVNGVCKYCGKKEPSEYEIHDDPDV